MFVFCPNNVWSAYCFFLWSSKLFFVFFWREAGGGLLKPQIWRKLSNINSSFFCWVSHMIFILSNLLAWAAVDNTTDELGKESAKSTCYITVMLGDGLPDSFLKTLLHFAICSILCLFKCITGANGEAPHISEIGRMLFPAKISWSPCITPTREVMWFIMMFSMKGGSDLL